MLEGRRVDLEETKPQGEPQQQTQEAEQTEETKQAPQPQLCRSGRIHT